MDLDFLRLLVIKGNSLDACATQGCLADAAGMHIELVHANRLFEGLAQLADGRFDCVLVDLDLPDSSGLEAIARVRQGNPRVPIVALTGLNQQDGLEAVKAGADDYLSKDDREPKLLMRTIRYAIERAGHRHADQQCREAEARYRALLDAVTTYTYSVQFHNGEPTSTQHSVGCLAATGYGHEEYAADPYLWFRMIHPDDRALVQQYVAGIVAGGKAPPIEHRVFHKNGSVRWIRNTIIQRRDAEGVLVGSDGLVEDVSQRKEAELALREREAHLLAAEAIQARLWPKVPPTLPGFDIAGALYPANHSAGCQSALRPSQESANQSRPSSRRSSTYRLPSGCSAEGGL